MHCQIILLAVWASVAPPRAHQPERLRPATRSVRLDETARPKASVDPLRAYRAMNAEAVAKTPKLASLLGDPDRFVGELKDRFAQQKELTPEDPYGFDFSDYGLPVLADVEGMLNRKVEKLAAEMKELEAGPLRWTHKAAVADLRAGVDYLTVLRADVGGHVASQQISYRRLIELSYFSARAMGHFDIGEVGVRDRLYLAADRHLQGYRGGSLAEERRRYEQGEFHVFEGPSPVKGFKPAEKPFEDAFFNKDQLELIALPTTLSLSESPFMRLLSYDVFLLGVTDKPFPADGFVRPAGDFWLHDIRHSSDMFEKRREYKIEHALSEAQWGRVQKAMDGWHAALDEQREQLDPGFRAAVDVILFNYHHDRGLLFAPSSYVADKVDTVPRELVAMLQISGQPVGFKNAQRTLTRAYAWLKDFWAPLAGEERALWGGAANGSGS